MARDLGFKRAGSEKLPALEFIGRMVGAYEDTDAASTLIVSRVEYGFSEALSGLKGHSFSSVIGVDGNSLALHALVEFANVLVFS